MSSLTIIGIFAVLFGAAYVLRQHPEWRITQVLFSFRGPFPTDGESYIHFLLRWVRFTAVIAAILATILTFILYVDIPNYRAPYYLEMGSMFVVSLGLMLAVAGLVGLIFKVGWNKLFRPTFVFDEEQMSFKRAASDA